MLHACMTKGANGLAIDAAEEPPLFSRWLVSTLSDDLLRDYREAIAMSAS
eukprot:COSAG05_NODE_179_length_14870_cov_351.155846_4_plen_50_part_00